MNFPAYPEYQDSGIEWLGEIPADWSIDRLKHSVFVCKNGVWGNEPANNGNDIACVRVADFDRQKHIAAPDHPTVRNIVPSELSSRVLSKGDLLLEKSGGGEKQPVGCVVLYTGDYRATCANFIARIVLAPANSPSFWRYVHAALYANKVNTRSIKQTSGIQNLDQKAYLDEKVTFPPKKEQMKIADFLDHETAKIDALIGEQRRLIELLQEKRQAVISHAVTKGLNPDAPMKDSGVEWLGEVPDHWEVRRLKHVVFTSGGCTPSKEREDYWNGDVPWVTPKDMKNSRIGDSGLHITEQAATECGLRKNPVGSVLIVVRGMILAHSLPTAITVSPVTINQDMKALSPSKDVRSDYLLLMLKGLKDKAFEHVDASAHGTRKLDWESFANILVPIPPIVIQTRMINEVKHQLDDLERLFKETNTTIALLQERRSALISAAVTGKIDVRGWQPDTSEDVADQRKVAETQAPYG